MGPLYRINRMMCSAEGVTVFAFGADDILADYCLEDSDAPSLWNDRSAQMLARFLTESTQAAFCLCGENTPQVLSYFSPVERR